MLTICCSWCSEAVSINTTVSIWRCSVWMADNWSGVSMTQSWRYDLWNTAVAIGRGGICMTDNRCGVCVTHGWWYNLRNTAVSIGRSCVRMANDWSGICMTQGWRYNFGNTAVAISRGCVWMAYNWSSISMTDGRSCVSVAYSWSNYLWYTLIVMYKQYCILNDLKLWIFNFKQGLIVKRILKINQDEWPSLSRFPKLIIIINKKISFN